MVITKLEADTAKMDTNARMAIAKMDNEFRKSELELRKIELEFRKSDTKLGITRDIYLGQLSAATNLSAVDRVAPLLKLPPCLEDIDMM